MRANVPVDNDMAVAQPVEDKPSEITPEKIELAKIGNSPNWKILQNYLDQRIEVYKNGLFGENLSGQDTSIIGQRFLAAQSVIQEFESLRDTINTTAKEVTEALKDDQTV